MWATRDQRTLWLSPTFKEPNQPLGMACVLDRMHTRNDLRMLIFRGMWSLLCIILCLNWFYAASSHGTEPSLHTCSKVEIW